MQHRAYNILVWIRFHTGWHLQMVLMILKTLNHVNTLNNFFVYNSFKTMISQDCQEPVSLELPHILITSL